MTHNMDIILGRMELKIIGGSFGLNGSAALSRDKKLVIKGAQKGIYSPEQILSVSANVTKEKKFGLLGFFVGAILASIVLGLFLGVLGVVIAIILAIAGSFYSEQSNVVEVAFSDNKSVNLECTPREVKKIIRFVPN